MSAASLSLPNLKLSRFDRAVLLTLLGLALLTGLMVWRGDQIETQVVQISPPQGATEVSTRAVIRVTFDQPMEESGTDLALTLSPPVTGTVRWVDSVLTFSPARPLAPETTYTVTLDPLPDQSSQPLSWQFRTRQPQLLYMAPNEEGTDQLYAINPSGGESLQLTREAFGVFDYTLSADGTTIAYAALREDRGSDLWALTADGRERYPLLTCPEAVCNGVAWAPDGQRLVYERRNMLVPGAAPGPPRLWWLNLANSETVPVFEDNQMLGYGASWSPDGQWLSYVAPSSQGVQIYNVNDGRSLLIPSRMGSLGVWSPQGDALLVTDIQSSEEGFSVHLLRVAPESGQLVDMSGEGQYVEDSSPAWSPDGAWIAFTRKAAGASMGKQIWLMRADGSQARYLTADPEIHHGLPAWSPAGPYLVFQRFPLKELGVRPSIWLLDVETGRMQELISPGNRPTWLP